MEKIINDIMTFLGIESVGTMLVACAIALIVLVIIRRKR